MKVSLIITTYNWPEALNSVLKSIITQTVLPDEVIIADDGSTEDTTKIITSFQKLFPCKLIHSWQEDRGFQLSKSRNKAIAKASSDYIILIDGDMVLNKHFIKSHKEHAKKGYYLQGGRVILGKSSSRDLLLRNTLPSAFSLDIRHRLRAVNNVFLSRIFNREKNNTKSTKSCNMSFWKKDVIKINGFNEDFHGWGYEDTEFCCRLLNSGKKRIYLKFTAVAYHIFHTESSKTSAHKNKELYERTRDTRAVFCKNGINKYL